MANSYSYMNEDAIDNELKCGVCHGPFEDPVSSNICHHTFCRQCITNCINRERRCPICRRYSNHERYEPVRTRSLLNQLNRILVQCDACRKQNIERGDFNTHSARCPKWIIPCTAKDIHCSWQGMRNQRAGHLKTCPFQQIRPAVDNLQQQIHQLQRVQSVLIIAVGILIILVLYKGLSNTTPSKDTGFFDRLHSLFD